MTKKHYRHLDIDARVLIENSLSERRSLSWMADRIGMGTSTVSREIRRNRRDDGFPKTGDGIENRCSHAKACTRRKVCDPGCRKKCSTCRTSRCSNNCDDYDPSICTRTQMAPWVCTGCPTPRNCRAHRWRYSAKNAQRLADARLVESREGIDLTGHEMAELAAVVKGGLAKNQSVHHIFASNHQLPCSERSFYRHVDNEEVDVAKMDLRKKVKYKKRNHARSHGRDFYRGHEYADYKALPERGRERVVQMDCVESVEGDLKAVLTLLVASLHFQIMVVLERKTTANVIAALDWVEELCEGRFCEFFGLVLTDRGCEFEDISRIEHSKDGTRRCDVYYADPMRSDQKGACEKAHVELRLVLPKGTSFDAIGLDAYLISGICSHVNSSLRRSIGDASPLRLARLCLPASLLDGLGVDTVPPDDVDLTPGLIDRIRPKNS